MSKLKIVFIAFSENSLGRRIINGIISKGDVPIYTLMASKGALRSFRKNGIKKYLKVNDIFNTLWRIYYRLTVRQDIRISSLKLDPSLNTSIREICLKNNIPIEYFDNINETLLVDKLKYLEPDLIILGGAPLIKKNIIEIPRIGVINSHPGILPFAKGMDVVSQSIIDNIPLGVSVFKVDEGMDSGPILLKKYLDQDIIGLKLHQIEALVEELSSNAMLEGLEAIKSGKYIFIPQEGKGSIYKALNYKKYKKVEAIINRGK